MSVAPFSIALGPPHGPGGHGDAAERGCFSGSDRAAPAGIEFANRPGAEIAPAAGLSEGIVSGTPGDLARDGVVRSSGATPVASTAGVAGMTERRSGCTDTGAGSLGTVANDEGGVDGLPAAVGASFGLPVGVAPVVTFPVAVGTPFGLPVGVAPVAFPVAVGPLAVLAPSGAPAPVGPLMLPVAAPLAFGALAAAAGVEGDAEGEPVEDAPVPYQSKCGSGMTDVGAAATYAPSLKYSAAGPELGTDSRAAPLVK